MEDWIRRGELHGACRAAGVRVAQHTVDRLLTAMDGVPELSHLWRKTGGRSSGVKRWFHPIIVDIVRALTVHMARELKARQPLKEAERRAIDNLVGDLRLMMPLPLVTPPRDVRALYEYQRADYDDFLSGIDQAVVALRKIETTAATFGFIVPYRDQDGKSVGAWELLNRLWEVRQAVQGTVAAAQIPEGGGPANA